MARINNIGEMGSPFLRPLSCFMGLSEMPLRRMGDEVVDNAILIQSLHFGPTLLLTIMYHVFPFAESSKILFLSA
jgi:hypothetical protein